MNNRPTFNFAGLTKIPSASVSMDSTRPKNKYNLKFGADKAVDNDDMTFAHSLHYNDNSERWFKIKLQKERAIRQVVILNRYWEQLASLVNSGLDCGKSEEKYKTSGCVGGIDGLKVQVLTDGGYVTCGRIVGRLGKSREDQTYTVECGDIVGKEVKVSRKGFLVLTEINVYRDSGNGFLS